jgi:hypothetical protein
MLAQFRRRIFKILYFVMQWITSPGTTTATQLMNIPLQSPRNLVRTLQNESILHIFSNQIIAPSGNQCSPMEEAELVTPSRSFNIVMAVQFALILVATAFSMYDYFYPRS